jgi:DNA polymerase elongation subunit (family B)
VAAECPPGGVGWGRTDLRDRVGSVKTLVLDIETSPNLAHVWGLFKQNVSLAQLRESSFVLCWAAKWRGEKEIFYRNHHDPEMIPHIRELMNEADAFIHYNGDDFDIPTLNQEIALHPDLTPPSAAKGIDLLKVVRRKFNFPSNKLDYVLKRFGIPGKVKHIGHDLWVRVLNDDPKAWEMMRRYNIGDVRPLEKLYQKLLPWIDSMPSQQLYNGDPESCPRCGVHGKLRREGFAYTRLGRFQRYCCAGCGGWSRASKRDEGVTVQAEV